MNEVKCFNCKKEFEPRRRYNHVVKMGSIDRNICEPCFKKIMQCSSCGSNHFSSSLTHVSGMWLCHSCLVNDMSQIKSCDSCGTFHYDSNLMKTGNLNICNVCVFSTADFHKIHTHSYSYKPEFRMYKKSVTDTSIPLGIELEVLNKRVKKSVLTSYISTKINTKNSIFYFKDDSSIENLGNGIYGESFELVSHPMTYNYIKDNKDTILSIMELKQYGCTSFRANTCGMHIHMDSSYFQASHLYRFLKMIYDNDDFTYLVSDRNDREWFDRYCSMDPPFDLKVAASHKRNSSDQQSRHVAVNMSSGYTVEVRIFKGTLNYTRFMKNIEFCVAMYEYTKNTRECSVEGFKQWLVTTDYRYLVEFLAKKGEI